MKKSVTPLVACAFIATPAFAAKPQIQWDPDYDFSTIETFQWTETDTASLASSDPFLHQHIINAIEYQLTSHGLAEVESNPDIRVTYHMSIDTNIRLRSITVGYGFGNYGRRGWRYYGYGFGGPVLAETATRVVEIERGSLMVDVWDADSDQLIWRGVAEDIAVSNDPQKMRRNVEKAIERMAKQHDKLRRRADE
jgi:hypothetical protein